MALDTYFQVDDELGDEVAILKHEKTPEIFRRQKYTNSIIYI